MSMLRALRRALLLVLLLGGAPLVVAQTSNGLDWLLQVQTAARSLDYMGEFTYRHAGVEQVSRISHVNRDGSEIERLQILGDVPREFIRHDDELHGLLPDQKVVLVERLASKDRFPGVFSGQPSDLEAYYSVLMGESDTVAGRPCRSLTLQPRDALRFGYRLCIDTATGLLLRIQTLDASSLILEEVAFRSLQIGEPVPASALQPSWSTEGWAILRAPIEPADVHALGWIIHEPPGFHLTQQLSRPLGDVPSVKQVVLSDGLCSISVFIEPVVETHTMPAGAMSNGALGLFRRKVADHWITVIGEAPPATLQHIAESVQFRP